VIINRLRSRPKNRAPDVRPPPVHLRLIEDLCDCDHLTVAVDPCGRTSGAPNSGNPIRQVRAPYSVAQVRQLIEAAKSPMMGGRHARRQIAEIVGKRPEELTDEEIRANAVAAGQTQENRQPFSVNLAATWMAYRDRWHHNRYLQFLATRDESVCALTDDEFKEKYGQSPVAQINDYIAPDFCFVEPSLAHADKDRDVALVLHNAQGVEVSLSALSSGEQLMLGLTTALYNGGTGLPKVLLFDETASSLHPVLAQKFLQFIREEFVKRLGIKCILVTHSPSLVALAPEDSIFLMDNGSNPPIKLCRRDDAIGALTAGVPTLRVDLANRRQVFVEDRHDVVWYEAIYLGAREN
jgi:energy-coupling factor transporter ATP-binding protein EcfA2